MRGRVYSTFRLLWLAIAVAAFAIWRHIHHLPDHQFRSLAAAELFIVALFLCWRPDGRFMTRRVKRR